MVIFTSLLIFRTAAPQRCTLREQWITSTFALGSLNARLLDGFDVDFDLDVVADHHTAGFQRLVPGQAEVFAADRSLSREDGSGVAPGIRRTTRFLHSQ